MQDSNPTIKYLISFILFLIAIMIGYWYFTFYHSSEPKVINLEEVTSALNAGEINSDKKFNEILNTDLNKEQESTLALASGGVYRNTGKYEDALKHIQMLKAVVLDPNQNNSEKAKRLNDLATIFCGFGRDSDTLRVVFTGEPFSQFWVEGDGALSAKKMLEWSYQEYDKRPMSAIFLSRWYVNRNLVRDLDASTVAENNRMAVFYMRDADNLVKEEILKNKEFVYTHEYRIYYFWKTFIVTGLALLGSKDIGKNEVELYSYKNLSLLYENQLQSSGVDSSTNQIYGLYPVARVLEAYFYLRNENDPEGAKKIVDKAMQNLRSDKKIFSNTFIEFLSDSVNAGPESGIVVKATIELRKIYPEFDKFMDGVIKQHLKRKEQI